MNIKPKLISAADLPRLRELAERVQRGLSAVSRTEVQDAAFALAPLLNTIDELRASLREAMQSWVDSRWREGMGGFIYSVPSGVAAWERCRAALDLRCLHGEQFPCAQCTTNLAWNARANKQRTSVEEFFRRYTEPAPDGLPDVVDVDGRIDSQGIQFLGKAYRQPDGTWRCLANVGGALCVVEANLTPEKGTLYVNGHNLGPAERDPVTGNIEAGPHVTARAEPMCSTCGRNVTDSPGSGCTTPKEHG